MLMQHYRETSHHLARPLAWLRSHLTAYPGLPALLVCLLGIAGLITSNSSVQVELSNRGASLILYFASRKSVRR